MTRNIQSRTSTAIQSLSAIALTLPGINAANAETQIVKPKVSAQYSRYDEGKNHYKIDAYNSLLEFYLGSKSDLTIRAGREMMTGASMRMNQPASLSSPAGPINQIVSAVTGPTIVEYRNFINANARYFAEEVTIGLAGDLSEENDFSSKGVGFSLGRDFNNKNTEIKFSYLYSDNHLKPSPFEQTRVSGRPVSEYNHFHDLALFLRQDLTDKNYITQNFEYVDEHGYLNDPYKSCFVYGNATILPQFPQYSGGRFVAVLPGDTTPTPRPGYTIIPDTRPRKKLNFASMTRFIQYIPYLESSIHLGYRFARNDWKIKSHTFHVDYYQPFLEDYEASVRLRYYTQNSAKFYGILFTATPHQAPFDVAPLGKYASQDWRLSKFGDITYEFSLSRKFMSDKSGKISLTGGMIDRKNKYYWGHQDKTPNPYNKMKSYYGSIELVFEM